MRMKKLTLAMALMTIVSSFVIAGCEIEESESEAQLKDKVANTNNLMKATKTPKMEKSLERENIRQRLLVSNDPTTLQWIYPMSAGHVLGRFPVKGKVTSGSKRLTPTSTNDDFESTSELPDEAGAYGSSVDYIFWFDPNGMIHQHRGDYSVMPVPYELDLETGTISTEIDKDEQAMIKEYMTQIKATQAKIDEENAAYAKADAQKKAKEKAAEMED